jgi:hypothetical protein
VTQQRCLAPLSETVSGPASPQTVGLSRSTLVTTALRRAGAFAIGVVVTVSLPGYASAQGVVEGIAPPLNPTSDAQCRELGVRWQDRLSSLEAQNRACERRDGGTVRASGVARPHCGDRQQAYVTCAPIGDQICWTRSRRDEAVQSCYASVAAHHRLERDRASAAGRTEALANAVRSTVEQYRSGAALLADTHRDGIVPTLIDRATQTPAGAADQVASYVREAARTTGTTGADTLPALARIGQAIEWMGGRVPASPVVREIAGQSIAAARARMADALHAFGGVARRADSEFAVQGGSIATTAPRPAQGPGLSVAAPRAHVPARAPVPIEPVTDKEEDTDDPELREAMERTLQQMQQLRQQLPPVQPRPIPSLPTPAAGSGPSRGAGVPAGPQKRCAYGGYAC